MTRQEAIEQAVRNWARPEGIEWAKALYKKDPDLAMNPYLQEEDLNNIRAEYRKIMQ